MPGTILVHNANNARGSFPFGAYSTVQFPPTVDVHRSHVADKMPMETMITENKRTLNNSSL